MDWISYIVSKWPATWSAGAPKRLRTDSELPPMGTSTRLPSQQQPVSSYSGNVYGKSRLDAAGRQRAIPLLPFFSYYSRIYGIPYGVLEAMAEKESNMNDPRMMRSGAGARGLMGIMPPNYDGRYMKTWRRDGSNPPVNLYYLYTRKNSSAVYSLFNEPFPLILCTVVYNE